MGELISRRDFVRAVGFLSPFIPDLTPLLTVYAHARPPFWLGWNQPWMAYGHDYGNAWGHDGLSTNGWSYETFPDTRGFTDTRVVTAHPCPGRGALRITADLAGQSPDRRSGEVYVSLENHLPVPCPGGGSPPYVDLNHVTARCRLWLPPRSAGPSNAPNGIQFFFKSRLSDEVFPALYTAWQNIDSGWEGDCVELSAVVDAAGAAYVDPDFDPTRVSLVGLKVGINSLSRATLTGFLYLDEYVLETDPPLFFDFEQIALERDLQAVRTASGGCFQVVRVFVFADGRASPEFATDGSVRGLDASAFDDLDALVESAVRADVKLVLVLLDFTWCSRPQFVSGVQLGGHSDVIRYRRLRRTFFERALKPILIRYGSNPAILAWDVMNEPEWIIAEIPEEIPGFDADPVSLDEMKAFVAECGRYVHQFAGTAGGEPRDHHLWTPRQGVTVGSARPKWVTLWQGLGLDLYQFHWYDHFLPGEPFPWPPWAELGLDRPCFVGEVPTASTSYSAADFVQAAQNGGYQGLLFWSCRARDPFSDLPAAVASAGCGPRRGEVGQSRRPAATVWRPY